MAGDFCELCGGYGDQHYDGCRGPDLDDLAPILYCSECGAPVESCTCGGAP